MVSPANHRYSRRYDENGTYFVVFLSQTCNSSLTKRRYQTNPYEISEYSTSSKTGKVIVAGWIVSPRRYIEVPISENVTSFGLGLCIIDEIKLRWGHTGLGGPWSTDWCPCKKKGIWKQVDTQRRPLEDRGHDWSDSSTAKESQGYQQPSEARGGKKGFLSYSLQRQCSCQHIDFGFLAFRTKRE